MGLTVPATEPTSILKGTTARWYRSLSDYPASSGWALSYRFVGPSFVTVSCSATQTDAHQAYMAATLTSGATGTAASPCTARLVAGHYYWQSYAASTGSQQRFQVATGELDVVDDLVSRPTTGKAYDGRSAAKRIVDAIDALLAGTATLQEQSISVDGRSLSNRPLTELLAVRDKYARIVDQETKSTRIANGLNPQNSVRVRFVAE